MSTKFMDWCRDYQGAISFVLIIMLLGFAAGISKACAQELPEGLEGEIWNLWEDESASLVDA